MSDQNSQIDDQGTMPLLEHLAELRNRLGICVAVFVVLFIGCLVRPFGGDSQNIADIVYLFLQQPLADILREQGRQDDFHRPP